jgi:carboxylesterase
MSESFYHQPEHQPFTFDAGPAQALLIHGFLGTPRELRPLGEALAAAGVTAHGVLLPGFGPDIARLRRVRSEDWLETARTAWREIRRDAERAVLIGFSMGGAVALTLAGEAGQAPDHLVLLAPHWKFADRRAALLPIAKYVIPEFKPFSPNDLTNPAVRQIFAAIAPGADLDDPVVQREVVQSATIPTSALDQLRRVGSAASVAARRLTAPASILQGLQDTTTLPAHSRLLARRIGAELVEFPGDHMIVDPGKPSWPIVRETVVQAGKQAVRA